MGENMKTIMVVDDDPDVVETVKQVFEDKGYEIMTAFDGDECLKRIEEETPDLILLDIMMPGISVKTVVDRIKDIKIMYLSAVWISKARKDGLCEQENVVDFIQKPFDIEDLISRVEYFLKSK